MAASTPGFAPTPTAASTPGLSTRSSRSVSVDHPMGAVSAAAPVVDPNSDASPSTHDHAFSLEKDAETSKEELTALPREDEADEISAADYDPDQGDDDRRRVHGQGHGNGHGHAGETKKEDGGVKVESDDEEEEEIEVEEEEEDDDEDDMFAIGTADDKPKKTKRVVKRKKKDHANVPVRLCLAGARRRRLHEGRVPHTPHFTG